MKPVGRGPFLSVTARLFSGLVPTEDSAPPIDNDTYYRFVLDSKRALPHGLVIR